MNPIHKKALEVATRFKQAEADLISVLQEVEVQRVFVDLGYTSLFNYCVYALGLSESVASNFVTVARKARDVPVLQAAIQAGDLSVSKARKIAPVLTLANQDEWVEKAKALSSRKLEEEVARAAPREAVSERLRFVAEDRLELRIGISKSLKEKLERARDLESQRTARAASIEDTLEVLLDVYLESKDPVKRAGRILKKMAIPVANDAPASVTGHTNRVESSENRDPIPAAIRHQVQLRDGGRCTHLSARGDRCESRRWIDIHHVRARSLGGANSLENLVTLCTAHHRLDHRRLQPDPPLARLKN